MPIECKRSLIHNQWPILEPNTCRQSAQGEQVLSFSLVVRLAFCAALAASLPALAEADAEAQKRLVEQKLKLVDMLVNAPAAQATADRDAESATMINRGKALLEQARQSLAAQQYADAARALDEALQNVSRANSRNAGGLSDSVQKQRLAEMREQVAAYRIGLADLARNKGDAATVQDTLQRVDALAAESSKLAAAGRLGEANKKMAEAYKLEVEEISRLRAGQEVVMSLKFDTPADEYAYEQKRYQSTEILVGMMLGEGRAAGDKRPLVDGFVEEAAKLRQEAAALAQANDHKKAVTTMEQAVARLNRALQAMGLPVF
jgi:hypothetical protein